MEPAREPVGKARLGRPEIRVRDPYRLEAERHAPRLDRGGERCEIGVRECFSHVRPC